MNSGSFKNVINDMCLQIIYLIYMYKSNIQGSLNKFPDFFSMGTFIDSTHMKLKSPSK